MLQKPKRFESESYKEFIRKQLCAVHLSKCKNEFKIKKERDPHHLDSVKSGGSDLTCVPLCRPLHTEVHMSREKFEKKYIISLDEVMARCLQKYIEEKLL